MSHKKLFVLGLALLLIGAVLIVLNANAPASVSAQGGEGECDGQPCPAWIVEAWAGSGHADAEATAFRYWDGADPKEVPVTCAKCHSEAGYLDFLGADGTEAGVINNPAPVDTVVSCTVCHNPVAVVKDSVVFPSGVELTGLGSSARCMECHQGRASAVSVNRAIEGLDLDTPNPDLRFINIHYFAAAASLFGSEVHGGYEYDGMAYMPRFEHVPGFATCAGCHDPHTLQIRVDDCATCHVGVASTEDLSAIRMPGSLADYDGDGDVDEGLFDELESLQALLYQAIQAYAVEVAGMPILYDDHRHPYFFADANDNGVLDEGEVGYNAFTPRLLQAAYNFQVYEKDPGAFAHNGKYHAQLLYDSIASLNEVLAEPIDLAQARRNPPGHFDATATAFRNWDAAGEVPAACAKCHTAEGLPFMLKHGVNIALEPSNSLACSTCHTNFTDFGFYEVPAVKFPSGAELSFEDDLVSNLCINCHQGRESTVSVNAAIAAAGVGDDEVSDTLRFRNIHYFAAGATLFGSEAQGAYQFEGKDYAGRNLHVPGFDTCAGCHDAHQLTVRVSECAMCHGTEEVETIVLMSPDYDGDGEDEGVAGEIATMQEALMAAIQAYAADTIGAPIAYSSTAYPYWFIDTNGNGIVDPDEANRDNGYASWTPTLLRAAYNYQYIAKDPGVYAHNGVYGAQILYDSIEAVGGAEAVAGMIRP